MDYLIGIGLGIVVCAFALLTGLDRDRAFYPTVLAVIPPYYILFAAMAGATRPLLTETAVTGAFLVLVVIGFKKNLWLIAAGLAGHGVLDYYHDALLIADGGVPAFWPGFCGAIDIFLGAFLSLLLTIRPGFAWPSSRS